VATLERDGIEGLTTRRVAAGAGTSTPAVYELFGDKAGLVRELFFEGFRQLHGRLEHVRPSGDPIADLDRLLRAFRAFSVERPGLADVMFSRPFADFDPGPEEAAAGAAVRELVVARVRAAVDAGRISGDPTDVSHVVLGLAQGLATQEAAGWLGSTKVSRDRRWALAVDALLTGLAP